VTAILTAGSKRFTARTTLPYPISVWQDTDPLKAILGDITGIIDLRSPLLLTVITGEQQKTAEREKSSEHDDLQREIRKYLLIFLSLTLKL